MMEGTTTPVLPQEGKMTEWDKMKSHEHYGMYCDLNNKYQMLKTRLDMLEAKTEKMMRVIKNE